MSIEATVEVSNSGGTTPNFTAAISNLGQFLEDMRSQLQPAVYAFVYDGETEKWTPHEPKGITLTIVDDTEEMLAAGDTITVTVTADEVNVTDPRRREPGDYHDAIVDGVMYRGIPDKVIYVEDESDLTGMDNELPGTKAATYGEASWWQWDGTEWTAMGASDADAGS
jgi:hypothetical protein